MPSLDALLRQGAIRLRAAGVESPRAEARRLLEAVTGSTREQLLAMGERGAKVEEAVALEALLGRREAREPLAYILGRREFYGRTFHVHPGVLVPRPESETLIEVALEAIAHRKATPRILDLGVGTGCLLLTLMAELPQARGVGTDRSEAALACARANAEALGLADRVELCQTSWADGVEGGFDLILTNPPYIPAGDLAGLAPEVRAWEPSSALVGGADGLAAYRAIAPALPRLLLPEGLALFEIGAGQERVLVPWLENLGFRVTSHQDLAGWVRCLAVAVLDPGG
jgi:release factor glutamine methyltransferase